MGVFPIDFPPSSLKNYHSLLTAQYSLLTTHMIALPWLQSSKHLMHREIFAAMKSISSKTL